MMLINPFFAGQSRLLDLRFDSAPIIDSTGRHTLSYPAGVTVSSGKCQFDGGSTSYITVDGTQSDFNWSANFYVVGTFTPAALSAYRSIWDTHEGGGYDSAQRLGLYAGIDGYLGLYSGGASLGITSTGVIQVGIAAEVAVFRNGTRCYIEVNGVILLDIALTTVFNHASRKMFVGGSVHAQAQFSGAIDDFRVLNYV